MQSVNMHAGITVQRVNIVSKVKLRRNRLEAVPAEKKYSGTGNRRSEGKKLELSVDLPVFEPGLLPSLAAVDPRFSIVDLRVRSPLEPRVADGQLNRPAVRCPV